MSFNSRPRRGKKMKNLQPVAGFQGIEAAIDNIIFSIKLSLNASCFPA